MEALLNEKDTEGNTKLIYYSIYDFSRVTKDVYMKYKKEGIINSNNHKSILIYLTNLNSNLDALYAITQNNLKYTQMITKSKYNTTNIVNYLLQCGANVNEINRFGETALMIAARHNTKDIIEPLLIYGADINMKDMSGYSILYNALVNQHIEIATILIEHGANINDTNDDEETILHLMCKYNCIKSVSLLLKYGVNIEI